MAMEEFYRIAVATPALHLGDPDANAGELLRMAEAAAGDSEDRLGPYELHDFFLYHFLANGASLAKLSHLAGIAFRGRYDEMTIGRTLAIFWRRFPAAQYKRNCVPDGPKITLSLSPRADWRMPSDSEFS